MQRPSALASRTVKKSPSRTGIRPAPGRVVSGSEGPFRELILFASSRSHHEETWWSDDRSDDRRDGDHIGTGRRDALTQHRDLAGRRPRLRRPRLLRPSDDPNSEPGPDGDRGSEVHAVLSLVLLHTQQSGTAPGSAASSQRAQPSSRRQVNGWNTRWRDHAGRGAQGARLCDDVHRQVASWASTTGPLTG